MKNQFYDGRLEIECFWQAKILFQQKKYSSLNYMQNCQATCM